MAQPSQLNYVLQTGETEGRTFSINGRLEILVMMPEGEDWGDSGDRTVKLQFLSPHEGEAGPPTDDYRKEGFWQDVLDPVSRELVVYWDHPGFIEYEGSTGVLYRLVVDVAGCHATDSPSQNLGEQQTREIEIMATPVNRGSGTVGGASANDPVFIVGNVGFVRGEGGDNAGTNQDDGVFRGTGSNPTRSNAISARDTFFNANAETLRDYEANTAWCIELQYVV